MRCELNKYLKKIQLLKSSLPENLVVIKMITFPTPGTSTPGMGLGISILLTAPYLLHSSLTSSRISKKGKEDFFKMF